MSRDSNTQRPINFLHHHNPFRITMPNTIIAIFSSFLLLDQMGLAQQWGSVPLTANSQMNFMPQMVGAMPQMMAASTPQTGAGAGVGAGTGAATGGVGAATPMGPTTGAANTAATANQWNGFVNINGVALPAFIPLTPLNSTKTFKRYAHIAKQKGLPVTGEQSFLSSWASMVQWLARPTMDYLSAYTKLKLEFNFFKLPKEGSLSPAPWAGHYWPRYLDGINFMWDGYMSPTAKYAKAFKIPVDVLERAASIKMGIDDPALPKETACQVDSQCQTGSMCAKKRGEMQGWCFPVWWGLCHAWAPSSYQEPEPRCPVRVGDVTFQVTDIKALLAAVYDQANDKVHTLTIAARCHELTKEVDDFGNYVQTECRDLNPGVFHAMFGNLIGTLGRSFLMDVSSNAEVWNHPARAYRVNYNYPLNRQQAGAIFLQKDYPFNPQATQFQYIDMDIWYVLESSTDNRVTVPGLVDYYTRQQNYKYILELDANGRILGGEWVGPSTETFADFLWIPLTRPNLKTIAIAVEFPDPQTGKMVVDGIKYKHIASILSASRNCTTQQ